MKLFVLFVVAVVMLPTTSSAETDTWPGPEWPSASCPYNGQEVWRKSAPDWDFQTNTPIEGEILYLRHEGDYNHVRVRWWPADAEAELLCGEKFIVFISSDDIMVEALMPRQEQE